MVRHPEVWCRNPPEGTPAGLHADSNQFVAMMLAMLVDSFDFKVARAVFLVLRAANFGAKVTAEHMTASEIVFSKHIGVVSPRVQLHLHQCCA